MAKRRSGPKTLASPLPLTGNERERSLTYPGMASFGGSGPAGKTCRECEHWIGQGRRVTGELKPGLCSKYRRLTGWEGGRVPDFAAACQYFVASDKPPSRYRGRSDAFG